MFLRYQVLKKLTELDKQKYPSFDAAQICLAFPDYMPRLIISCIHDLREEGFVSFSRYSGTKFYNFEVSSFAKAYLYSLHEEHVLTTYKEWENRFYGFISAIALKYILSFLIQ